MKTRDQRNRSRGLASRLASRRKGGLTLLSFGAVVLGALALCANAPVANAAPSDCAKLLGLKRKDTTITEATVIPAAGDVPEYCRVQGGLEKVILFEVALPTAVWNSKLYYVGGGGYNGS